MNQNILHIINITFIVIWTYTGLEKLLNWNNTYNAFHNQTFPPELAELLVYMVPAVELILAVMLLFAKTRKGGLLLSTLVLTVFTTYIGLVWIGAFPRIPCSCAGFIESMSWEGHLMFNGLFIVLGGYGVMRFEN